MKKSKKNHLFKLSFFISLILHVIAIAYINHMKIRSYLLTGNISFSNKSKIPCKKKASKEVMNLVLKQKQKDFQKFIENNQIQPLPQQNINKNFAPDIACKNDLNFYLPTLIANQITNEKENLIPTIQTQNVEISSDTSASQPSEKEENYLNQTSNVNEVSTTTEFQYSLDSSCETNSYCDSLLCYADIQLPELPIEKQKLFIPLFELKNEEKSSSEKTKKIPNSPKTEKEKKYSMETIKEFYTKANDLFKFKELIDNEKLLTQNIAKFKKKETNLLYENISLIDMPSLNELTTLPYKNYFDIEVTVSPKVNEKGYIFAITFVPKSTIKLNRLKQNIFFLVDRSNSIQKDRLTNTRHAITSSLSFLNEDDTFNILAFDTKLDVLSTLNLKNDHISISRARGFLRNQNIGSFFSSTNFSIPLYKILEKNVKNDEINIAILLSNGDGLNKFKNNKIISNWSQSNKGNLSLYTICLNDDKNMSVLEFFSSLNKGKLLASDSTRGIKRKLQKLLKSISSPIAKDIVTNVICMDDKANIKLYPSKYQSPHLYIDEPYTILGTIDKLQDFTIFLQGKCKNNVFNLKKHIHFDEAKQGGTTLQKELAMKQASICYEKFLIDNNPTYLQEANNHLKLFDMQPIFR